MKRFYVFSQILFFSLAILLTNGCKKDKDDDKEETKPDFKEVAFDKAEILDNVPVGIKESANEYASGLYAYIQSAVNMSSFINSMKPPDNAQKVNLKSASSDTYKWSISYEGETLTYYWTYSEDASKDYWDMQIQFNDGPIYDYIKAWQTKDGEKGEIKFNFNWAYAEYGLEETEIYYWIYDWDFTVDGKYYFNYYIQASDDSYNYEIKCNLVLNSDGSGTLDYYFYDTHYYHYLWDNYGNGSVTYYAYDPPLTYSWTVTK